MIIHNGNIEFKLQAKSELNAKGYATTTQEEWSSVIPCQFRAQSQNRFAYSQDEQYEKIQYEILIDKTTAQEYNSRISDVRLTRLNGDRIGIFQIESADDLHLLAMLKLIVK